jgi:hypothetical protein
VNGKAKYRFKQRFAKFERKRPLQTIDREKIDIEALPHKQEYQWTGRKAVKDDNLEFTLKEKQFYLERVKTIISAFGLGATVVAALGLWVNYQQGVERLVTERFAKAVEQLGSDNISVRIGGIYSLERIAKDSLKDQETVIKVLTAFIQNTSSIEKTASSSCTWKNTKLPLAGTDVRSAIEVIGRRGSIDFFENPAINLED